MSISDNALYESYNLGYVVCHPHVYCWRKNLDKWTKTSQICINVLVILVKSSQKNVIYPQCLHVLLKLFLMHSCKDGGRDVLLQKKWPNINILPHKWLILYVQKLKLTLTSRLLWMILSSMSVMTITWMTLIPKSLDKILCRMSNLTYELHASKKKKKIGWKGWQRNIFTADQATT